MQKQLNTIISRLKGRHAGIVCAGGLCQIGKRIIPALYQKGLVE